MSSASVAARPCHPASAVITSSANFRADMTLYSTNIFFHDISFYVGEIDYISNDHLRQPKSLNYKCVIHSIYNEDAQNNSFFRDGDWDLRSSKITRRYTMVFAFF